MPKRFTTKDAKEMIRYCRELLKQLQEVSSLSDTYDKRAQKVIRETCASHALTKYAEECLTTHQKAIEDNAEVLRLLSALKDTEDAASLTAQAQQLSQSAGKQISEAVNALSAGSNIVKWLFTGAKDKNRAEKAWTLLDRICAGTIPAEIEQLYESSRTIMTSKEDLVKDYRSHPEIYEELYTALNTQNLSDTTGVGEISHLIEELDRLEYEFQHTEELMEKGKQNVTDAVNTITSLEAQEMLKDIPVDEINREKKGYRLKPLKDAGITTIADLERYSAYHISEIQGISDTTAAAMKQDARQIAEETRKTCRIRLSADDRNPYTSALTSALSAYRQKLLIAGDIRRIRREKLYRSTYTMQKLQEAQSGTGWLFASDEEKQKILDAYTYINDIVKGNYAAQVADLFAKLESLSAVDAEEAWNDFEKNSITFFNILEDLAPGVLGNEDGMYGLPEELAKEVQAQELSLDGLKCTLRRYQEWGVKYILHQGRVLLGDEMGLGKTIQAIASMVALRQTGATHFVVVCPASVLPNWCKEIGEKSDLTCIKVHGSGRESAWQNWIADGGVAVTTFETTGALRLEEDYRFDMLIVDEAHYIKNPEANRSLNVKALGTHAQRMLFMTGTALENKVEEMLSLLSVLQPEISSDARSIAFMASAPKFREKVAPVYYRRKREDVLTELPELIDNKEWVTLSQKENLLYERHLHTGSYADIRRVSWNVGDLTKSCKAIRMKEIIEEATGEGRKIIVFSFFLQTLKSIREYLGEICTEPITGSVPPAKRQQIIDDFNNAPAGTVLPAQIQSGGTGLNIQSASVVILAEPQLKPSIENQAISRAYRMGQARNVLVYRLLADDTVDERIIDLLADKQAVFDAFADTSAAGAASLESDKEVDETTMAKIVKEEIERINAEKEKKENDQRENG